MSFLNKLSLIRRRRPPIQYEVTLPDGTERQFELESRASGETLLEACLLSVSVPTSYHVLFGLAMASYDQGTEFRWIRLQKALHKEVKGLGIPVRLQLRLLLYPRDHRSIVHPVAKQLMYSQVRQDLCERRLKCNAPTLAKLAGLVAQGQMQDFSRDMLTRRYISQLHVLPDLTVDQERAAIEEHKLFRGMSTEECVEEFLCIAQSVNSYGAVTSNVQDSSNWSAVLAYGPSGVQVIMGGIQTALIQWESVIRIHVRNRHLTFHTENAYNYSTLSHTFRCASSKQCRRIANLCILMRNHYCGSMSYQPPSRLRRFLSRRAPRQQNSKLFSDQLTTTPARSFSMSMAHSKSHSRAPPVTAIHNSLPRRLSDNPPPPPPPPHTHRMQVLPTDRSHDRLVPAAAASKSSTLPAKLDHEPTHTPPPAIPFSQPPHQQAPRRRSSQPNPVSHSQPTDYTYHRRTRSPANYSTREVSNERPMSSRPRGSYYRLSIPALSNEYYQQQQQQHRGHNRSFSNVQRQQYYYQEPNGTLPQSNGRLSRVSSKDSVATLQQQMSLAGMSQGSQSFINPHILSLVYQSSQGDTTVL